MSKLPFGANFKRAQILWELGLHIAGNPQTRYGGDRDMRISVGSGAGRGVQALAEFGDGLCDHGL